jgi:ABC-type oligopeptide transport system substrate-binding subunit
VLTDAETWRLVETLFDWGTPARLALKGKAEMVPAYRPLKARPAAGKARGLAGVETPLVGRTIEVGRLQAVLEGLHAGSGGIVMLVGEAGIGKTRLIGELRTRHGGVWLEGRCVSYGGSLPYWPFRDLVRDWLGATLDDPDLRVRVRLRRKVEELFGSRFREIYPYLCSLLGLTPEPEAESRIADLAPEALQYRTFEVVGELLEALASAGPLVVMLEDLHWADTTSVELVERLLDIGERAAVLIVIAQRDERDHPSWRVRERAARDVPHLLTEIVLQPLSGDADRALLDAIVGPDALPPELAGQLLETAEGNPFYLEELIRSLIDQGALTSQDGGWRFDHAVPIEVPPTVERVVLARIDRLPGESHEVLTAASALGRRFSRPLLEAVLKEGLDADGIDGALHELQRLDLVRAVRRWPQAELKFKHALIQDAAYRTLVPGRRQALHRGAALWLEARDSSAEADVLGLLAHHWLEAGDADKAVAYLARAGDQARHDWSLDAAVGHYRRLLPLLEKRGEQQEIALTLFKLALALHQALRFGEANEAYQRAFEHWTPPQPAHPAGDTLRVAMRAVADDADPYRSHRIVNIQLFMAMFDRLVDAWPDHVIVPSIADHWEISDDGLRYLVRLRQGVRWSDGVPLSAHDVEYGVKRALDRERPGPSAAIFFVLEHARDYLLGKHDDLSTVGVRALDDRTVEFRLIVPAPYFMFVLNRPDCAPQPRHVIEAMGDDWTEPGQQVVSGAFARVEHGPAHIVLERRSDGLMPRTGNVGRVEIRQLSADEASAAYQRDELDLFNTQFAYQPALADRVADEVQLDPPAFLDYLALRHAHPSLAKVEFRRALALAIDRQALLDVVKPNATVATGGMVPPPLQGHTPDIGPGFDPDAARDMLRRSGVEEGFTVTLLVDDDDPALLAAVTASWHDVLDLRFPLQPLELEEYLAAERSAAVVRTGWFPGYPDPEYFLGLLLHSDALDNHGGYHSQHFDGLIERARAEPDGRARLELFHMADRFAVAEDVAAIPLQYVRNMIMVKPWVHGWWEYGKTWSSYADLSMDPR